MENKNLDDSPSARLMAFLKTKNKLESHEFDYSSDLTSDGDSSIIEGYLTERYEFRRNIISGNVEARFKRSEAKFTIVNAIVINSFLRKAGQEGLFFKKKALENLLSSDYVINYNPFIEYGNSLPKWKEDRDYIHELASTITVPESSLEYWNIWLTKWLVASLGSILRDDVINHTVLILTGKQGLGKSRWLANLVPPSLKEYYYSGPINPTSKDSIINCAECMFINMDELGSFIEKNTDDFKELITKEWIRIRRPYSRDIEKLPRRASFFGSTNKFQFLHDRTGSRRILAFEALEIKMPDFEIDLLWAQVLFLYQNGYRYYFDEEETKQVNAHNMGHQIISFEEELILGEFDPCKDGETPDVSLKASQILQVLSLSDPLASRCNIAKLGKALQSNGFKPRKSNGNQLYDLKLKAKESKSLSKV